MSIWDDYPEGTYARSLQLMRTAWLRLYAKVLAPRFEATMNWLNALLT
jgi:hypothetical protein